MPTLRSLRSNKRPIHGTSKAAVAASCYELGGPKRLAERMGRRLSTVYGWADRDQNKHAPFDLVCKMVELGARAPVEHMCAVAGGAFMPGRPPTETMAALFVREESAHGRLVSEAISVVADPSRANAALLPDLDATIDALMTARTIVMRSQHQSMMSAASERGCGVAGGMARSRRPSTSPAAEVL